MNKSLLQKPIKEEYYKIIKTNLKYQNLKIKEFKYLNIALTVLLCSVFGFVFLSLLFFPAQSQAATKTWDSGGANDNCSTIENWDSDTAPVAGDDIVINSTADAIIWDSACPQTVNSFLMDTGFTGSVQVNTTYSGDFNTFTITTNLTINAGTLTHKDNSSAETYKLNVSVGGNFTLGAGGIINADGLGYDMYYGPGYPPNNPNGTGLGGSHGGFGGHGWSSNYYGYGTFGATYGSVTAPINLGSSGARDTNAATNGFPGGGAIQVTITGSFTHNGTITCDGSGASNQGAGGAGGSVFITTGSLSGAGSVGADGGSSNPFNGGGGGGRISVILTGVNENFSNYSGSVTAKATSAGGLNGAAGTVYKQTTAQGAGGGTLTIDNNNLTTGAGVVTDLDGTTGRSVSVGTLTLQNKPS